MQPTIAILSAFLTPFRSGAEACVEEVPLCLASRYRFVIVTAKLRRDLPRRDLFQGAIPVRRIGLGNPLDKWLFPFLAPFAVRRIRPDLLHAVLESYAGLALVFCRLFLPRTRTVLTCQSTNTRFLAGLMHRYAHRITVISNVLKRRAERFGRKDSVLIPNGIRLLRLQEARKSRGKIQGRVLFVGRLESMKGVDVLLRAFAKVSHDEKSLHLRVVGDGSKRRSLEAQAKALGLEEEVSFIGPLPADRVSEEYAEAEVFCGLSRSEALGNVFLEAQAAGCAVIATRVGGIPDIVSDGETGLLVPADDVDAAAAALKKLLSDAKLRETLVRNGGRNADRYDWMVIAEQYGKVYREDLTERC